MTTQSRSRGQGAAILSLGLVAVLAGTLAFIISREPHSTHTWRFVGDVDAGGALLVLGGLIFPLSTVLACRMDRVETPRPLDHFRQCSLLYAALIVGGLALATNRDASGGLLYAISALAVAAALSGVIANAITLAARARPARTS